ncbi:hypothetical protein [Brenneria uluponensis]|nr:hypothetical protein [Brenneria ulupoensis]
MLSALLRTNNHQARLLYLSDGRKVKRLDDGVVGAFYGSHVWG